MNPYQPKTPPSTGSVARSGDFRPFDGRAAGQKFLDNSSGEKPSWECKELEVNPVGQYSILSEVADLHVAVSVCSKSFSSLEEKLYPVLEYEGKGECSDIEKAHPEDDRLLARVQIIKQKVNNLTAQIEALQRRIQL